MLPSSVIFGIGQDRSFWRSWAKAVFGSGWNAVGRELSLQTSCTWYCNRSYYRLGRRAFVRSAHRTAGLDSAQGGRVNFVLVLAAPVNTIGVTTTQLHQIAQSVTVQLNRDVSTHWGGSHMVRVGEAPSPEILPGEIAFALVDELPSAPGAVAYHDIQGNGVPVAFEALSMCNSVLSGPDS